MKRQPLAEDIAIGAWLSAALSPESHSCPEFKRDIEKWFATFDPLYYREYDPFEGMTNEEIDVMIYELGKEEHTTHE